MKLYYHLKHINPTKTTMCADESHSVMIEMYLWSEKFSIGGNFVKWHIAWYELAQFIFQFSGPLLCHSLTYKTPEMYMKYAC